jgi:hypothetical protein
LEQQALILKLNARSALEPSPLPEQNKKKTTQVIKMAGFRASFEDREFVEFTLESRDTTWLFRFPAIYR